MIVLSDLRYAYVTHPPLSMCKRHNLKCKPESFFLSLSLFLSFFLSFFLSLQRHPSSMWHLREPHIWSIAELECCISDLYWIWDEEKLLEPVIALSAGPPVNLAELDSTIPAMDAALPVLANVGPTSVSQLAPGPGVLLLQPDWLPRPCRLISNQMTTGPCWAQNLSVCLPLHWILH